MMDYLAEVTMSILQKQKERDPALGYARDFIGAMESVLGAVAERGVRIVANAGGVNPQGCAAPCELWRESAGRTGACGSASSRATICCRGSTSCSRRGHTLANMDTGEPLSTVRDRVLAANAYIGSTPIVEALGRGANVVVTGRSTDTALTMAPLRHEFGWGADAYDRWRRGSWRDTSSSAAPNAPGGNCLYDWRTIPDLANVGYPIVEATADGTFVVTKHPGTGGIVSVAIGDRAAGVRDGRSALVYHARRHRRLHLDSARGWTVPIACASTASPVGRRPTSSRCPSRTAPGSRR